MITTAMKAYPMRAAMTGRLGENKEGDDRADEVDEVLHVDELGLGEVVQGSGALLDAMGGLARMVFLMPGQGRLQELAGELICELLPDVHGDLAFNDPPRTMQRPTQDISAKRGDEIITGVAR
jgi:hypothetical protein